VTNLQKVVTPAKAGVQCSCNVLNPPASHSPQLAAESFKYLDTGFRRYEVCSGFSTFYKGIKE